MQAEANPFGPLARATQICIGAAWHRDQLESRLEEFCRIFGTTADTDCIVRDWCIGVVCNGESLDELINKMAELQRDARENCSECG